MRKILSITAFLFITIGCAAGTDANTNEKEIDQASMIEVSEMDLDSSPNKVVPIADNSSPVKDEAFWMQKLDCPELEKARQEKLSNENKEHKPEAHSIWHIMAMYIPNRLIDLTDIFTMELGFGPQASFNLTFTKWFELGGMYGDNYFVEKGYNRQYGGGYNGGYSYSYGWESQDLEITDFTFGTVKNYIQQEKTDSLLNLPSEEVYRKGYKDFWKLGLNAGWLVNFGVAFHPVALANFFTGFVFVRLTDTEDL